MEDDKKNDNHTPTPKKGNPFLAKLRDNQVAQAREALLKTVVENAGSTIGSILDALEVEDGGSDFIMLDLFRRLTLDELAAAILSKVAREPEPEALEPGFDEDDDGGFENDGSDDEEEPDPEPEPKAKKAKGKKKNKGKKSGKKEKKKAGSKKEKAPKKRSKGKKSSEGDGPTKADVLRCLVKLGADDEESAVSSKQIRDEIGGTTDEMRRLLKDLYEPDDKIDKVGEARGTKYFLM